MPRHTIVFVHFHHLYRDSVACFQKVPIMNHNVLQKMNHYVYITNSKYDYSYITMNLKRSDELIKNIQN
jgi:hypothetical protein